MDKKEVISRRRRPRRRRPRRTRFRRGTISSNMKRKSNEPQQGNVMRMTPNRSDAFSLGSKVDINEQKYREDILFNNISADRKIKKKNDDSGSMKPYDKTYLIPSPLLLSTKSNSGGDISKRLKNRKSRNKRRSRTARGKKNLSTIRPASPVSSSSSASPVNLDAISLEFNSSRRPRKKKIKRSRKRSFNHLREAINALRGNSAPVGIK